MIGTILNLSNLVYSQQWPTVKNNPSANQPRHTGVEDTGDKYTKGAWANFPNNSKKRGNPKEEKTGYWNSEARQGFGNYVGVKDGNILYCPGVRDTDIGSELQHCVVYYAYGSKDMKGSSRHDKVANLVFPLPEGLMDEVALEWNVEESNQMRMRALLNTMLNESFAAGTKEVYDEAKNHIRNMVANITGRAGTFRDRGIAKNTHQELYFKGINFRQFSFKHTLMPTSSKESEDTKNIVDTFKYLASPGWSTSRIHFTYPSQWEIHFLHRDENGIMKTNTHLTQIGRCVLDKVGVNYTSDGAYQSFRGGEPTSVELELSFREIDLVTKHTLSKRTGGQVVEKERNIESGDM